MKYFKIIHKGTGTVMCYGSHDDEQTIDEVLGDVMDTIREVYGEDQYGAEYITKEEYDLEIVDLDAIEALLQEHNRDFFIEKEE